MVNRKNEGIEALNEILLRMSYELGKTLSENTSIINEQSSYTPLGLKSLPLDYYYYDKDNNLKTLPNLATNYPAGSTPAKKAYPGVTNGLSYPQKRSLYNLPRFDSTTNTQNPPPQKPKSTSFTPPDTRSYQDATYVSPQNLMGGGGPPKPKDVPKFTPPDTRSYQDATYVAPQFNPTQAEALSRAYELEKRNSKPIQPKSEVIMYDPRLGRPTPKWIYNGKKYDTKESAFSVYEKDRQEWEKKYGDGFDAWVLRNSDTIHDVLGIAALGLALVSMGALTVLTGGAAAPLAGGLSLEMMAGIGSLLLSAPDAALYAYEGDKRMAMFVALLSVFDVAQILKAAKGLNVTANEVKVLKQKAADNAEALTSGSKKQADVFTQREIQILNGLDGSVITTEGRILAKNVLRKSVSEMGSVINKSADNFVNFLKNPFKQIKAVSTLAKTAGSLVLVIDGIQMSYNFLYNLLASENQKIVSLTYALIQYALTKPEVQNQIVENNKKIEQSIEGLPEEELETLSKVVNDFSVKVKEGSLSQESMKNRILERMNQKEKEILPGTVKMYGGSTQKKTPFTTQEEGDKFRKWFNTEFPTISKYVELDLSGAFDNTFIRRAFNTPLPDGTKTVGQIYLEETQTEKNNDSVETTSSEDDMG